MAAQLTIYSEKFSIVVISKLYSGGTRWDLECCSYDFPKYKIENTTGHRNTMEHSLINLIGFKLRDK